MVNKKWIVLILIILLLCSCIILLNLKTTDLNNVDDVNESVKSENSIKENITNLTKNSSYKTDLISYSHKDINSKKQKSVNNNGKTLKDTDELTSDEIKKIVERSVSWDGNGSGDYKNVKIGKPYKAKNGFWLVPAYDAKTNKFIGSVWVFSDGNGFSEGPDSYSDYKKIVSGKSVTKDSSTKSTPSSKSTVKQNASNLNTSKNSNVSENDEILTTFNSIDLTFNEMGNINHDECDNLTF